MNHSLDFWNRNVSCLEIVTGYLLICTINTILSLIYQTRKHKYTKDCERYYTYCDKYNCLFYPLELAHIILLKPIKN